MDKGYKIVYKAGTGEIVEKKSRFIAEIRPVESEEAALKFIEEIRKKNWNATHNCYAYTVGDNNQLMRCSDDGEPPQTAGKPMLDVLILQGIHNAAAVVTRYFGGTLLGTGGLVRAYSKAVQEGLVNSTIIEKKPGKILDLTTDYNGIGKIQYLLGQRGIKTIDSEYSDKVELKLMVPINEVTQLITEITEATNGKSQIREEDLAYFAIIEGEVTIL